MPMPRPPFGSRLLTVGLTWGVLALVALWIDPAYALAGAALPLGLAARAAWRARAEGRWHDPGHQLRRQVSTTALLLAGSFLALTMWSLRGRVPSEVFVLQVGLLLHYWLLALA